MAAKTLLGRIISGFIKGTIGGETARTSAYLLQTFCSISKECELDELNDRLQKLEKTLLARQTSAQISDNRPTDAGNATIK